MTLFPGRFPCLRDARRPWLPLLLLAGALAAFANAQPATPWSGTTAPVADAFGENGASATANFNGVGLVAAARGTTSSARKIWAAFDLPSAVMTGEVTRAALRFTLSPQEPFVGSVSTTGTAALVPVADVRIRSSSVNNQGADTDLAVGPVGPGDVFRTLLSFDLSLLATAPTEASLRLTVAAKDATSQSIVQTFRLYRVTRNYIEDAASWTRASSTEPWQFPGGDYDLALLSELALDPAAQTGGAQVTFPSTPAFVQAVSEALATEGVLHLVLVSSAEDVGVRSFIFFNSREDAGKQPQLIMPLPAGAPGTGLPPETGNPVRLHLHAIVDGQDAWNETGLTWNNAPKNATASATGVKAGTALLAVTTVETGQPAGGATVQFEDPRLAQFLNWAAGRRGDLYGSGVAGDPDQRVTFIVTVIDAGTSFPGVRFVDREAANAAQRPALDFVTSETAPDGGNVMENDRYRVTLRDDLRIEVVDKSGAAGTAEFAAQFEVVNQTGSPGFGSSSAITGAEQAGTTTQVGFSIPAWGGNPNFAAAPGTRSLVQPVGAVVSDGLIVWRYAARTAFGFRAQLELPAGSAPPRLSWSLSPAAQQYWTVGYAGAPSLTEAEVDSFYVPGIWSGRRFMAAVYLIDEIRATLPAALQLRSGVVRGVAIDPFEVPRRVATTGNSLFALTMRTADALNRPTVYAPIYGSAGSQTDATLNFSVRLVVRRGELNAAFRDVATEVFAFRDYRENLPAGSLNATLDNFVDFTLNTTGSNFSYWIANVKANEYVQDKPGYSRFQSAPTMLGLALIRDDANLYEQRARPSIEYFISRLRQIIKNEGFDPEYPLGGPVSGYRAADWYALAGLTGGRTSAFLPLSEEALRSSKTLRAQINSAVPLTRNEALDHSFTWLNSLLNAYRHTRDPEYLADARHIADAYITHRIDVPAADFRDVRSGFWNYIAPVWQSLFELYDLTGEVRYADAAAKGAEEFVRHLNFAPALTGGHVRATAVTVPAWQVSDVGLVSEASTTSGSHRGIFMPYCAAALLRVAAWKDDPFLAAVARSNVVGRYLNYPGYTLRNTYNAAFLDAGYPLRFYPSYQNTAHMNHPVPQAAMLVDFLLADVEYRSRGAVRFPHQFTDSGAYFRGRLFGHAPGEFHGDSGVWPWLPRALVSLTGTDAVQLNYVAGHGNGRLYLAFSNQSPRSVQATVALNAAHVLIASGARMRVWRDNVAQDDAVFVNGVTTVTVSPGGITALAIEEATPVLRLRADYLDGFGAALPAASYAKGTHATLGSVVGTIISLSPQRQHAHVYASAGADAISAARLRYRINGGAEQQETKAEFPFEFTVPLAPDVVTFRYVIEGTPVGGGGAVASTEYTLQLGTPPQIAAAPVAQSVFAGHAVELSVSAGGIGPFTYQWRRNGVAIPGADAAALSLAGAPSEAGSYDVVVTNAFGSATSAAAVVTVQLGDLLAYALGATGDAVAPPLTAGLDQTAQRVTLTFLRARADVVYRVEGSSDLATWSTFVVNPGEVGDSVTVADAVALEVAGRRFLRLRVELP